MREYEPLRQFLELTRTLNFGKAARASHVSPSALSRSVQRLESQLGEPLFEREHHKVSLTPTGEAFHGTPLPGVNGVKLYRGQLYATNTARRLLLRVPITAHGTAAPVVVRAGLAFDDFAIEPAGTFVAALNISDQVVRFTATGPVTVLADRSHDGVENPRAVALGHHGDVLVTGSAYFGSHPALQLISSRAR